MLHQFNVHCEANSLMPDYQSAYRINFSCETAVTRLVNDILWAMENQNVAALSAIDLSAAFNTVDHNILLEVLKVKFGISSKALDWFNNYLRPRFCKVNMDCEYSTPQELSFSVLQGRFLCWTSAVSGICKHFERNSFPFTFIIWICR